MVDLTREEFQWQAIATMARKILCSDQSASRNIVDFACTAKTASYVFAIGTPTNIAENLTPSERCKARICSSFLECEISEEQNLLIQRRLIIDHVIMSSFGRQ
jgi:hypothetical protein